MNDLIDVYLKQFVKNDTKLKRYNNVKLATQKTNRNH